LPLLLQLPPLPGRNYMYSVDYVDEISRDKLTPEGELVACHGVLEGVGRGSVGFMCVFLTRSKRMGGCGLCDQCQGGEQ
jgi:hypothetical protein